MGSRKCMKLHEVQNYLQSLLDDEEAEEVAAIYLQPPDAAYDSAEDDADENEGGFIIDLHHSQLHQEAEIEFFRGPDEDGELNELETEPLIATNDQSGAENDKSSHNPAIPPIPWRYVGPEIDIPTSIPLLKDKFKWSKKSFSSTKPIFPAANYLDCAVESHVLFERFIDDDILQMICDESNQYGVLISQKNPEIAKDELKVFFGIMIVTGYNNVSNKRSYWMRDSDLHNEMVSRAMSRDRFCTIERFIHFASKTMNDPNDKMWKLRPLMDKLKANLLKNFHPEENLSYDESMIKYFGRHSCKQFIKGKPLRFGYKVWCLNTPDGYLLNFEVYQGKNPRINPELEKNYGKCVAPLLQFIHEFPEHIQNLSFSFYFDNLFTGIPVLDYLKKLGHHGTGTIRETRIPHNCPLPSHQIMNKSVRGKIESVVMKDYHISITKWRDNKCVCVASTLYGKDPVSKATRFNREERRRVQLDRPHSVENYNKNMGGTDRMDQNIGYYRCGVRKNKWWWSIFTWLVDVSVDNAWLLQRKAGYNISQLQFRRNLATHYCNTISMRVSNTPIVPRQIIPMNDRYDGIDHYPCDSTKRRCQGPNCSSRSRVKCEKCDVALCVHPCFKNFHILRQE